MKDLSEDAATAAVDLPPPPLLRVDHHSECHLEEVHPPLPLVVHPPLLLVGVDLMDSLTIMDVVPATSLLHPLTKVVEVIVETPPMGLLMVPHLEVSDYFTSVINKWY